MKVSEVLARKRASLVTVKPSDSIETLSRLMRDNRIGAVVVSATGEGIDGFVSERDLAYSLCQHMADLHKLPVSAIMTKTVITCSPGDSLLDVGSTMQAKHVRHIPVVEGNRALGMISIRDVLNVRVEALQRETAMLRSFASQGQTEPQDR